QAKFSAVPSGYARSPRAITVPGTFSRSFAVASLPERSRQSAMSPAPTSTAALPDFAGVRRDEQLPSPAKLIKYTKKRKEISVRKLMAYFLSKVGFQRNPAAYVGL